MSTLEVPLFTLNAPKGGHKLDDEIAALADEYVRGIEDMNALDLALGRLSLPDVPKLSPFPWGFNLDPESYVDRDPRGHLPSGPLDAAWVRFISPMGSLAPPSADGRRDETLTPQEDETAAPPTSAPSPPRRSARIQKQLSVKGAAKKTKVTAKKTKVAAKPKRRSQKTGVKERVTLAVAERKYKASVARNPKNMTCPFESCGWVSIGRPLAHKQHVLSHAVASFKCKRCKKALSREDSLKAHMRLWCPRRPGKA